MLVALRRTTPYGSDACGAALIEDPNEAARLRLYSQHVRGRESGGKVLAANPGR
jgi:hypothetical protein